MHTRLIIGLIGSACLVAACGHSTPAPKAPVVDNSKPVAREASKACTASSTNSKAPKPLGTPRASSSVALAQSGTRTIAYIADEDAKTIQTVDVDSKAELASTPLDGIPSTLMVMPDGRVLVAIKNQARVEVFDAGDKPESALTLRCAADTANEPLAMALTPDDKTVLVATGWGHALGVYSADRLAKKSEVLLGREPRAVVSSDDGKTAWVSHAVGSQISSVDIEKGTKKEISLRGRDPSFAQSMRMQKQSMDRMKKAGQLSASMEKQFEESMEKQSAANTRPSVQGYALAKSIDPPGRILAPQVFVDAGDPTQRAEGYGHDSSPTESQDVAVIDEGTSQPFEASLNISRNQFFSGDPDDPRDHHGACLLPRAAAVDTKTKTLLVTCFGLDEMISYDAAAANPSLAEKRRWRVGGGPSGVAVDPAKHRAVVWSQFDRSIHVVSLEGRDVVDEKKFPPAEVVAFNLSPMKEPLAADYQLGRLLFHNANDSRIARDGRACASCHPDGRDDSITWATPLGPRRTILLAGRVGETNRFSWSGTERTLHEHLDTTFDRLSGQGVRSLERDAIVKYIKTLAPPNENAAHDEASKVARGKTIFASSETECASCHTPTTAFSDNQLHDVKSKTESDKQGTFNTPSLKGVGGTGPWFHDGRYATLKDLLKKSDGKMGKTKQLSDADLDALESYLRSI